MCERVFSSRESLALLIEAQKEVWPYRVALAVSTWTGEHGRWPIKLAPFLIPPFRTLFMNEHGDFFAGTPAGVLRHARHRVRDAVHSGWNRLKDIHRGGWLWAFALIAQRFSPLRRFFAQSGRRVMKNSAGVRAAKPAVPDIDLPPRSHLQMQVFWRIMSDSDIQAVLLLAGPVRAVLQYFSVHHLAVLIFAPSGAIPILFF